MSSRGIETIPRSWTEAATVSKRDAVAIGVYARAVVHTVSPGTRRSHSWTILVADAIDFDAAFGTDGAKGASSVGMCWVLAPHMSRLMSLAPPQFILEAPPRSAEHLTGPSQLAAEKPYMAEVPMHCNSVPLGR
jgi:hypothetical protein